MADLINTPIDDTQKSRVVLCFPVTDEQVAELNECSDKIEVINAGQSGIAEEIMQADIFVGHAKVPVPWAEVVQQGRLKWIQSSAAGLDHCLKPEVIDSDILVSSVSGLLQIKWRNRLCPYCLEFIRKRANFLPCLRKT